MLKYSYHIHINGLVQGVGFRPFVCRLAKQWDIAGWVSNTNDGVHIEYSATEENATTEEEVFEWITKVNHPVLGMEPLM